MHRLSPPVVPLFRPTPVQNKFWLQQLNNHSFSYLCLFQLKSIPEFQSKSIPFKFNKKGLFLPGGTPGKE